MVKKKTKKKDKDVSTKTDKKEVSDDVIEDVIVDSAIDDATTDDVQSESVVLSSEILALKEALDIANQQVKDKEDKVLRTYAELENFKKRKEQEKADFMKFSSEKLIVELLPIMDSFDMAASQAEQSEDPEFKSHVEGFLLIQKQLHGFLDKMNVVLIDPKDQPFNPTFHQAVMQESVEGVDANIVIKVMQVGYTLGGRVIRPAMVVVSQ